MKKTRIILGLAAAALLATVAPSLAVIDNSHHDATRWVGATAEGVCFYCHGLPQAVTAGNYGPVGDFCVARCHRTGGVMEAVPQGPAYIGTDSARRAGLVGPTTLDPAQGSHPVGGTAGNAGYVPPPDTSAAMTATTWPYTSAAYLGGAGNGIQCTSCHAVHDNDRGAPFIWTPMGRGVGATDAANSFCSRCHNMRHDVAGQAAGGTLANDSATTPFGSHPVEMVWNAAAAAARGTPASGNTVRRGRTILMDNYGAGNNIYDVAYGDAGTGNFDDPGNNYVAGGHTGAMTTTGVAANDYIGCYSCHSAHVAGPQRPNNLTLAPGLVATSGAYSTTSPLCVGCHGTTAARNNPGVTAWYHPVNAETPGTGTAPTFNYVASIGGFTVTVTYPNNVTTGPLPLGTGNQLLCTTCHDVHGAVAGDMAIQNVGQGTAKVCGSCHGGGEGNATTANAHHMTYTAATKPAYKAAYEPSWAVAQGIDIEGELDCADCHVFNGTAHNW